MSETYVTYRVWDGCKAPNNLESGARLVGQRVSSVSVDRDALLALADEMDAKSNDGTVNSDPMKPIASSLDPFGYVRRIREACGKTNK